ncbi:MAG: hypothetical protein GC145_07150 [Caulobacter sp.]|nr:hypothetical protein [Caulobacter sp.]
MLGLVRTSAAIAVLFICFGFGQIGATQDPPAPVQVYSAADRVNDQISRIDAATARVKAHRFAPAYYAEPCSPTKMDGEKSLSPYRAQRRQFGVEARAVKSQILGLEKFSTNKLILAENGWNWQNPQRFRPLESAQGRFNAAIAAAEARLDAMPELACRPAKPKPPKTQGPTQADADLLQDFALPPPAFDDPIPTPKIPEKFCSYSDRRRFLAEVYWPFYERTRNNAVLAIDHMANLERRRNEIGYREGRDSARYRAAQLFVTAWEPVRNARTQAAAAALALHDAVDAVPVTNCQDDTSQPANSTGTTPPATTPAAPPPPSVPLPDGVVRPYLPNVADINLPTQFCSESAKMDFLVNVYHPRAAVASHNAVLASTYAAALSDLALAALDAGQMDLRDALDRERTAYQPILKDAETTASRWIAMRGEILAIPVVACPGKGDPPPLIQPPPPAVDAGPTPKPSSLPPPDLKRPALRTVAPLTLPASFCSEFERKAYLEKVYKPAAADSLANAETTKAHLARLQAMFTRYMRQEGGPGWAAVRQELALYEPIARAAYEEGLRIQGLYAKIMAIPVVSCEGPDKTYGDPAPTPPVEKVNTGDDLAELIVRGTRLPSTPEKICDEAQRAAQQDAIRRARQENDRDARALQERRNQLNAGKADGSIEPSEATLADLVVKAQRIDAKRRAIDAAQVELDGRKTQACPPPKDEAPPRTEGPKTEGPKTPATPPTATPAPPPATSPDGSKKSTSSVLPGYRPVPARGPDGDFLFGFPQHRFCSRQAAEDALRDIEDQITNARDERDRFETDIGIRLADDWSFVNIGIDPNKVFFYPRDADPAKIRQQKRAELAFGYDGLDRLLYYDGLIDALEARREQLMGILVSGQYESGDCPDLSEPSEQPRLQPDAASTPVSVGPGKTEKPCPPRQGRDPINVGPNSKVGSGAKFQKDLGNKAVGVLAGALGLGGGGGGGGGPQLYRCRIKDSEMTVFNDPATGVSLKVGAKRGKGDVVNIFADIAKSPDKGTFQTAFLERPDGQVQTPFDVGPCDLWGEWELTVSWTKTTYVDGQMVSQESGGWSESGKFVIPGMLSKVDAPTGLWKQMGFSSASHGARKAFMSFHLAPGSGPMTFVIHITRPKGDPVMTVPFVMTIAEDAKGGFTFTKAREEDCPPTTTDRFDPEDPVPYDTPPVPPAPTAPPSSAGRSDAFDPEDDLEPPTDGPTTAGSATSPARPDKPAPEGSGLPPPGTFSPDDSDASFADYLGPADVLSRRKVCSREEALRDLALVNDLLPLADDAVENFELFVGARIASGYSKYGLTGKGDLRPDSSPLPGLQAAERDSAKEVETVRVQLVTGQAGGTYFHRASAAQTILRRTRDDLKYKLSEGRFDPCPGAPPPPP